jgi:hypothetical protein
MDNKHAWLGLFAGLIGCSGLLLPFPFPAHLQSGESGVRLRQTGQCAWQRLQAK